MGERGRWLGFVGTHDGNGNASTVAFVDEEGMPDVPTTWFVRTEPYATICASPFFHEAVVVPAGRESPLRLGGDRRRRGLGSGDHRAVHQDPRRRPAARVTGRQSSEG